MKKKLLLLLLAAVISATPVTVCCASGTTAEAQQEQPVTVFDSDAKKLDFRGSALATDYQGSSAVVLAFDYTNKTSEAKSPLSEYFTTVFQNGVSLPSTTIMDAKLSSYFTNALSQVKDGGSITYFVAYTLSDNSDLELQITDSIAGSNVQTITLSLPDASSDISPATSDEGWEAKYSELLKQYEELRTKYNELEQKYNELSNQ